MPPKTKAKQAKIASKQVVPPPAKVTKASPKKTPVPTGPKRPAPVVQDTATDKKATKKVVE